jgi:hypothetical protein
MGYLDSVAFGRRADLEPETSVTNGKNHNNTYADVSWVLTR